MATATWTQVVLPFTAVRGPVTLTLAELKQRPKQEIMATLECGGNGASASFMGAVANVRWTGTPLAPLLRERGLLKRGGDARSASVEITRP